MKMQFERYYLGEPAAHRAVAIDDAGDRKVLGTVMINRNRTGGGRVTASRTIGTEWLIGRAVTPAEVKS